MQLTRFDRWLREKFSYETHIQLLRLPEEIPRRIKVVDMPDTPGRRYMHLLIARRSKDADAVIDTLKENSQMYHVQIIERDTWLAKLANPKGKSLTWWAISWVIIIAFSLLALMYLVNLFNDPEIQEHLRDALESIKG